MHLPLVVLLELQRMAAEKYAEARTGYDYFLGAGPLSKLSVGIRVADYQRDAAALSKLVRIGLGIEPAEER